MPSEHYISVLIMDQQIVHRGLLSNAAFVLGLTAGRELPAESFGTDVIDGSGKSHRYLTNIGHYVRQAGQSKLRRLRESFLLDSRITLVDYPEDAAPSDYDAYRKNLSTRSGDVINYRAIHVYGPESIVAPLTKNLSRLQ